MPSGERFEDEIEALRALAATRRCAFGDETCPCQDGDVCHYVDHGPSGTKAMAPPGDDIAWVRAEMRVGRHIAHDTVARLCDALESARESARLEAVANSQSIRNQQRTINDQAERLRAYQLSLDECRARLELREQQRTSGAVVVADENDRLRRRVARLEPVAAAALAWVGAIRDPIGLWAGDEEWAIVRAVKAAYPDEVDPPGYREADDGG